VKLDTPKDLKAALALAKAGRWTAFGNLAPELTIENQSA
jgi:hypothetical protein